MHQNKSKYIHLRAYRQAVQDKPQTAPNIYINKYKYISTSITYIHHIHPLPTSIHPYIHILGCSKYTLPFVSLPCVSFCLSSLFFLCLSSRFFLCLSHLCLPLSLPCVCMGPIPPIHIHTSTYIHHLTFVCVHLCVFVHPYISRNIPISLHTHIHTPPLDHTRTDTHLGAHICHHSLTLHLTP